MRPEVSSRIHGSLIALLVGLRPLVWDEDPTAIASLVYLILIGTAVFAVVVEGWAGVRRQWRWSWTGLLFALLVVALLPAALRSPLPVQGWSLWLTLLGQFGLAAYLAQAVPGRERVALAALGAGLLGESLVAALQWPWVLPAMEAARRSGELASAVAPELQGDLGERIANGGLFGTFTLANGLAGYLLLAAPPLAFAAVARGVPRVARILAGATLALAALAFLGTASKGAYLALAAAGAAVWWWRVRGGRRWLGPVGVALAVAAVLLVPALRDGLRRSAEVRVGYWQAAAELARERPVLGGGLRSYAEDSPRALPIWAEYSVHAHDEPLEAAAEAGIPVALLLLALLAWLAWPARAVEAFDETTSERPSRLAPVALALGLVYLALLGALDSNLGWWPGGGARLGALPIGTLAWSAVLALAMASAYAALLRLPRPPGAAIVLALGAFALHCLVDFDLHSGAIVGTVAACAVLAPGPRRSLGDAARRPPAPALLAATAALLVYVGILAVGGVEAGRLRDARAIVEDLEALRAQPARERAQQLLGGIAEASGQPEPAADALDRPQALRALLIAAFGVADRLAGPDYELRTRLLAVAPSGPDREPFSAELAKQRPRSSLVQALWAHDARAQALAAERAGDAVGAERWWSEALARLRRSRDLAPLVLRARIALIGALREAAEHVPSRSAEWRHEADEEQERVKELETRVNPRNRI